MNACVLNDELIRANVIWHGERCGRLVSGGVAPAVAPNCGYVADLAYRVILEPEPDGSAYNAIIPAFPHAHTFGATVEEAMANARDIIKLELEVARERDEEIPVSDAGHVVIGTVTLPAA